MRDWTSYNRLTGIFLLRLILSHFFASTCAGAVYQSDGSASSVQNLHRRASNGDTIALPAGTFTWSTPVTISKAIKLQGAGSGRIIGNTKSSVSIGTGTKSFETTRVIPGITAGQILRIAKMPNMPRTTHAARENYMEGAVTSYSGTTLVMNIASTGGSGSWHFWWIATKPTTTIVNNYENGSRGNNSAPPMLQIQQSLAGSAEVTGFQFTSSPTSVSSLIGIRTANYITPKALIHGCWFQTGNGGKGAAIFSASNQVVIWNCSFDDTYELSHSEAFQIKAGHGIMDASWSTNSTMGMDDVDGAANFYIEDCDFHAHNQVCDADDNARVVIRHCIWDNSQFANHGADTSAIGVRHIELYDNELAAQRSSPITSFRGSLQAARRPKPILCLACSTRGEKVVLTAAGRLIPLRTRSDKATVQERFFTLSPAAAVTERQITTSIPSRLTSGTIPGQAEIWSASTETPMRAETISRSPITFRKAGITSWSRSLAM